MSFELLTSTKSSHETRLGKLQISGNEHETPLYVGLGSRGVIPHLSPDMLHNYTSVPVLYLAMEDCKREVTVNKNRIISNRRMESSIKEQRRRY